jgi:hypothetical protein
MPLTKCTSNGKSGWKWGDAGHCYTGPGAKKKAIKQGVAEGPEKFKKEMGDATRHYDVETLTLAKASLDEYNECAAKIVETDGGFKILGQGEVFPTYEAAINFQYGDEGE